MTTRDPNHDAVRDPKSEKDDVQVGAQATSASLDTEPVPASASNAPAVPLAGVPETPLSNAGGIGSTGPAVPSTDHVSDTDAAPQDGADPTAREN